MRATIAGMKQLDYALDIHKIAFIQNYPNGQNDNKMLTSSN